MPMPSYLAHVNPPRPRKANDSIRDLDLLFLVRTLRCASLMKWHLASVALLPRAYSGYGRPGEIA